MLLDTKIKGRMGSPSVAESTKRLSAGTSPESVSDTARRPPQTIADPARQASSHASEKVGWRGFRWSANGGILIPETWTL
jgi:hypothetical protein